MANKWQVADLNSRSLIPMQNFLTITSKVLPYNELNFTLYLVPLLGETENNFNLLPYDIPYDISFQHFKCLKKTAMSCPDLLSYKLNTFTSFYSFSNDLFQVMSSCLRLLTKCTLVYSVIA